MLEPGGTLLHAILGAIAATFAAVAGFYAGLSPGAAILAAGITGFLVSGAAYLARLVANLSAEVDPDRLVALFEWLTNAVKVLEMPLRRVSLVATSRSPEGIRLIQVPEVQTDTKLLESMVIASASRGEPLVHIESGRATIVMAGRLAGTMAECVTSTRGRRVLKLETPQQLRSLYKLLRSLYQGGVGAPRRLAAYMAVKAIGKLVYHGLLTFHDWRLAEEALHYIPAEPPWIKFSVRRQLEKETLIQP